MKILTVVVVVGVVVVVVCKQCYEYVCHKAVAVLLINCVVYLSIPNVGYCLLSFWSKLLYAQRIIGVSKEAEQALKGFVVKEGENV